MTMQLSSIGSYRIIRLLGEGTFGVVYEAYQPFLDRKVAIKTLHADLTATAQIEQQFMQEARTIARLRHHHIVAIHEFGTIPTEPNPLTYMVMEYLSGETLLERIRRSAIELPLLVVVIEKIAEGLDYAHAHQVIHRDLKPANVIFSEGNEPVIVDFGLAKLMALTDMGDAAKLDTVRDEKESTISGTPAYMSPEQAAGEPVSHATDQCALATMTY